jgi:hypothetical protein
MSAHTIYRKTTLNKLKEKCLEFDFDVFGQNRKVLLGYLSIIEHIETIRDLRRQNKDYSDALNEIQKDLANYNHDPKVSKIIEKFLKTLRVPIIKNKTSKAATLRKIEESEKNSGLEEFLEKEEAFCFIEIPQQVNFETVTFSAFLRIIESQEFVHSLTISILSLIEDKMTFYKFYITAQTELLKITQKRVEMLKQKNVSSYEIERLCPGYSTINSTIALANEMLTLLITRKAVINEEIVKDNLQLALLHQRNGLGVIRGRSNIKDFICSKIYSFSKNYRVFTSFNNIALYGSAGSGKTKIAQVLSWVYSKIFIVEIESAKITTKADFVASYVGQTSPKTQGTFFESLGGVLFIDEAYELGKGQFGAEALAELVNLLDKFIGKNICIVAGYKDKMVSGLMGKNEGMHRRFPHQFTLENYSARELTYILIDCLRNFLPSGVVISKDDKNLFYTLLATKLKENPKAFPNQAGDIVNLANIIADKAGSIIDFYWDTGSKEVKYSMFLKAFLELSR